MGLSSGLLKSGPPQTMAWHFAGDCIEKAHELEAHVCNLADALPQSAKSNESLGWGFNLRLKFRVLGFRARKRGRATMYNVARRKLRFVSKH